MKNILVIFDCFGVLCDKVFSTLIPTYVSEDKCREIDENIVGPAEVGEMTRDEYHEKLSEALDISVDEIINAVEKLTVPHSDLYPVIEKIKDFADVALLSNAYEGHAERILKRFNIEHLFDRIFLSYKCKLVKPDKGFYLHCVNSFGKKYDAVYMVDDTEKNLVPLSDIGITPIKYTGVESVTKALNGYFDYPL